MKKCIYFQSKYMLEKHIKNKTDFKNLADCLSYMQSLLEYFKYIYINCETKIQKKIWTNWLLKIIFKILIIYKKNNTKLLFLNTELNENLKYIKKFIEDYLFHVLEYDDIHQLKHKLKLEDLQ